MSRGYAALVASGHRSTTEALIELFCRERTSRADIARLLADLPEVRFALNVAGDSDAVLLVRTRESEHLEQLLLYLRSSPTVERTRAQVIPGRVVDRVGR